MKTIQYITTILFGGLMAFTTGCSQDDPFEIGKNGEGFLNRDAMSVEFKNSESLVRAEGVNIGDFRVEIRTATTVGDGELVKSYSYSQMPEIVALPVGNYVVNAIYGNNEPQGWECPYYLGSSTFSIESGKVADDIEPVVCTLSNMRVTINFGQELSNVAGADAKVTVKVGEAGSLDFTKADEGRSGYFAYTPGSQTITATFSGTIDGEMVHETKSYDNAAGGNHYKISFDLHSTNSTDPGSMDGSITVDATVTEIDMTQDIQPEDQYETDDMRPVEDLGSGSEDPVDPTPPTKGGPSVIAEDPISLDIENEVYENSHVVLNISTEEDGGITGFLVHIDSETLTAEELIDVDLAPDLDLVNPTPASMADVLSGLGLPVYVGGMKEVKFDISGFIGLLNLLGSAHHTFTVTVSDASGTTVKSLRLHNNL